MSISQVCWFPILLRIPTLIRRSPTMTRPLPPSLPPSTWPATVSAGRRRACGPIRHGFRGREHFPNGNRLPSRFTSPAASTPHLSLSHVAPADHNLDLPGNRDANTPGIMVSYFAAHPRSHPPFPNDDASPPSLHVASHGFGWPASRLAAVFGIGIDIKMESAFPRDLPARLRAPLIYRSATWLPPTTISICRAIATPTHQV
jgi:hypothetical protein